MHAVVTTFSILTSVFIVALLALAVQRWLQLRDRAVGWLTLAFLTLGVIVTVGRLIPATPHGFAEKTLQRLDIELLVLFPYLLYRFATEFVPPSRRLQRIVAVLTVGLSIWTFAIPKIPAAGEPRPPPSSSTWSCFWLTGRCSPSSWRFASGAPGASSRPWRPGGCGCSRSQQRR